MDRTKLTRKLVSMATNLVVAIGRTKRKFLTIHTRPMYAKSMPYRAPQHAANAACAIILQGPIKKRYRFTLETVKFYSALYPNTTIILSTWDDEDTSAFERLAAQGVKIKIIRSKKPASGGPGNINMQVASTKAGIALAISLKIPYVIKTRTDQRMYGIQIPQFLINLLQVFPLHSATTQKKRIVGLNITTTTRYTPYHLSDLWMFGTTEDMRTYWDFPYTDKPATDPRRPLVERTLFVNFLTKTGWRGDDTMADFLKALGERCIIVGNESIDLFWPKYYEQFREYRIRDYEYPNFEISFKEWFAHAFIPTLKTKGSANQKTPQ